MSPAHRPSRKRDGSPAFTGWALMKASDPVGGLLTYPGVAMPWDRTAGTKPVYRTKAHRDYRASLVRQLQRDGYLECTAKVCLFDTRDITNPHGNDPDGLHAGHNDAGTEYDGPQHNLCNIRDGAVRARARQDVTDLQW